MSTDLYSEDTQTAAGTEAWRAPTERAPSPVRADEPKLARFIGLVSLSLIVLGAFTLMLHAWGKTTLFGPDWGPILASLCLVVGVGGLLFHAARDADAQVRFMYMCVGYGLMALGVAASLIPAGGRVGAYFLPYGLPALWFGLFFSLAYVRHETDEFYARITRQVLLGLGALMAGWGFIYGNISLDFLMPQGVVLVLLGLLYLGAFVNLEGVSSDLGYRVALGLGALGALVCLVALGRAALISWGTLSADSGFQMMPGGMTLTGCGLLYLAVSAALCWDHVLVVLTRREFVRYFYSPIAYFVLFGFTFVGWVQFSQFVLDMWGGGMPLPVMEPAVSTFILDWWPVICVVFLIPVLTMGQLSEEHRTGTLEVLLTSPVNEPAVVVSKLLGALAFYLLIWLPWGLYVIALRIEGGNPFDYRPVLGFYLVMAITGLNFLSMGIFFSSLTRNQIISAVFTFAIMLTLLLSFILKQKLLVQGSVSEIIVTHIGFIDLWFNSLQGRVAPRDLLLHLSFASFWSFLTVKVLESRKWR